MRYQYECDNCDYTEEHDLSIENRDDYVGHVCPNCPEGSLRRSVGNAGFKLKGGGWADDGYATHWGDTKAGKKALGKKG